MKKYLTYITISALAFALIASPVAGFAKEKDKSNKGKNEDKTEVAVNLKSNKEDRNNEDKKASTTDTNDHKKNKQEKNKNKCIRAFGHLIAPGWLKKNSAPIIDTTNCWFPFGIGKKFQGHNATTTVDVTAPVITNIVFTPAQTQAEVRWTTNENSDSAVFLSTTSTVDTSASSTMNKTNSKLVKNHQLVIKSLTANTTYYVIVRSRDAAGNTTVSTVNSFKTLPLTTDTTAPVLSGVITSVGTSSIQVGWNTNENTTSRVYYSNVLPVLTSSTTAFVSNSSSTQTHALTISGLNSNTTYYIVIEATDASGNVTTSATFSAKTSVVVDATAPVISGITQTIGASTTTISWTTNEPATSRVFYGTSTPLNIATAMNSGTTTLNTAHSVTIMGLATSTAHYFKVQSVDTSTNTTTSNEFAATTTSGM